MALPTSFKTLLNGGVVETARIEFKATWDPQASLKTICAFANDIDNWGGGYLVIGVTEDNTGIKHLTGIPKDRVDSYLKDMLNKCKLIQPSYMPITEIVHQDGKFFIMVWVPGGINRPYSSPKAIGKTHNNERVFWIRKMASTITPTETEKRDLYNLANNVPFDDRINHSADISDLSLPLIKNYLKEVGSSLYQRADHDGFHRTVPQHEHCRRSQRVCQAQERRLIVLFLVARALVSVYANRHRRNARLGRWRHHCGAHILRTSPSTIAGSAPISEEHGHRRQDNQAFPVGRS